METNQLRFLRMLSEQAAQNVTIVRQNERVDLSTYALQLRTKNGMIYQMYSNNDESLRYRTITKERKVMTLRTSISHLFANSRLALSVDLRSTNDSVHRDNESGPITYH